MKTQKSFKEFGLLEYENQILTIRLNDDVELTKDILEKIFLEGDKMSSFTPYCFLADARPHVSATIEAIKYAANNPYSKNHLAYATLANTMAVIIMTNFFIRVYKPIVPSRLFKNEADAIKWLNSFLIN